MVDVLNEFFLKPRKWFCDLAPVLKLIKPWLCPQQENRVNCALFTVAVSVHILAGFPVWNDAFTQQHIMQFQQLLPSLLGQENKDIFHCDALQLFPEFEFSDKEKKPAANLDCDEALPDLHPPMDGGTLSQDS